MTFVLCSVSIKARTQGHTVSLTEAWTHSTAMKLLVSKLNYPIYILNKKESHTSCPHFSFPPLSSNICPHFSFPALSSNICPHFSCPSLSSNICTYFPLPSFSSNTIRNSSCPSLSFTISLNLSCPSLSSSLLISVLTSFILHSPSSLLTSVS